MTVLVTGAHGFIGKNLCAALRTLGNIVVYEYDKDSGPAQLVQYAADCDFIFHLAGVNRPDDPAQFVQNQDVTALLIKCLQQAKNYAPIVFASSIQAQYNTPYANSKRAAERLLLEYGHAHGTRVLIYRLGNVFGKWSRPNYNSVVATFCSAAAKGQVLPVNDPDAVARLVYIDDVVDEFLRTLRLFTEMPSGIYAVHPIEAVTVGWLACCIAGFPQARTRGTLPDMGHLLTKRLYSTYLSHLPPEHLSFPLTVHADSRGAFAEFLRLNNGGQVSVNRIAPHQVKGGHYHHTKAERFLAVSGRGEITLTPLAGSAPAVIPIDGEHLTAVDIPPGMLHSIANTAECDLVVLIWANEWFDASRPDTYRLP